MSESFLERYQLCKRWDERVTVIEIFHLAMKQQDKHWTVTNTAGYFNLSIGLISESLKLAEKIHSDPNLLKCKSRYAAMRKMNGFRN